MTDSDFLVNYWYYELRASSKSITVPFDYIVQYINEHPGFRCFIFADRCTKDGIDAWLNDERVKVHWWEDMTKTHANNPDDFDELSDVVEALNELIKPDFGAIIEVCLPVTSEELLSLYYPTDSYPAGEISVTNSEDLDGCIIQQFRSIFGNDLEWEDVRPLARSLYSGWVMFGYEASSRVRPGADFRLEYITIPSYSDVDISSINWGELLSSDHTTF